MQKHEATLLTSSGETSPVAPGGSPTTAGSWVWTSCPASPSPRREDKPGSRAEARPADTATARRPTSLTPNLSSVPLERQRRDYTHQLPLSSSMAASCDRNVESCDYFFCRPRDKRLSRQTVWAFILKAQIHKQRGRNTRRTPQTARGRLLARWDFALNIGFMSMIN